MLLLDLKSELLRIHLIIMSSKNKALDQIVQRHLKTMKVPKEAGAEQKMTEMLKNILTHKAYANER